MSAATSSGLIAVARGLRLPRLRALPGGEPVSAMASRRSSSTWSSSSRSSYPLGIWMAHVYSDALPRAALARCARARLLPADGHRPAQEQDWKGYAKVALVFMRRLLGPALPAAAAAGPSAAEPGRHEGVSAHIAMNTTASFVTNTNWQYYGGEFTMSYLSQMAGLAVQNFVSAGVGMAVLVAVIRGFSRRSTTTLGNFWVDLYRSIAYILLPLAARPRGHPHLAGRAADVQRRRDRAHARGRDADDRARPGRSQIAIKQLGTNGGGFFNSNSAVPFENPNGFTNFLEMLSILLIPASQVFMFGRMVGNRRQALPVYGAMLAMSVDRHRRRPAGRAAWLPGAPRLGREPHAGPRPERRQHGRQGGPLRDRQHRALGGDDDERLERLRQRRP